MAVAHNDLTTGNALAGCAKLGAPIQMRSEFDLGASLMFDWLMKCLGGSSRSVQANRCNTQRRSKAVTSLPNRQQRPRPAELHLSGPAVTWPPWTNRSLSLTRSRHSRYRQGLQFLQNNRNHLYPLSLPPGIAQCQPDLEIRRHAELARLAGWPFGPSPLLHFGLSGVEVAVRDISEELRLTGIPWANDGSS